MRRVVRLTEGDLHVVVENSVRRILKEYELMNDKEYQYRAGKKSAKHDADNKSLDKNMWDDYAEKRRKQVDDKYVRKYGKKVGNDKSNSDQLEYNFFQGYEGKKPSNFKRNVSNKGFRDLDKRNYEREKKGKKSINIDDYEEKGGED